MRHEKIFVREDGTKVKIGVSIWADSFRDEFHYNTSVMICAPKKRTWINSWSMDNFEWRRLNHIEMDKYAFNEQLKSVTREEIQEVALELWEKLKPSFTTSSPTP